MTALRDKAVLKAKLAGHPLFRTIDVATHDMLLKRGMILHFDPGEILYAADAEAEHTFIVLSGAVQIEYPEPGEVRGHVASILAAPCFLGECQVLHARPWSGTGVALFPILALAITKEVLESMIIQDSKFALLLYREITLRFLRAIDTWKHQPKLTPAQSLARYLLGYAMVRQIEGIPPSELIPIRQVDLGRATGLRRETINRLLKTWAKEKRLTVSPRGLADLQIDRLEELMSGRNAHAMLQTLVALQ